MNPTSIEVVIKDGKIETRDPRQLPTDGRGRLTTLSAQKAETLLEPVTVRQEDGLPAFRATGRIITTELVRRLEAEGPW